MNRETSKLKTEVVQGRVLVNGYRVYEDNLDRGELKALEHDALYAHALVQAMHDALDVTYCGPSTREGTMQWTALRADEILREWGIEP